MPNYTDFDKRMKKYEKITDVHLIPNLPVVIRLDGRHFHTFAHKFNKPFDSVLVSTMQETMKYLCKNIQNCVFGYTQSDEISLLLVDYKDIKTEQWVDNRIQKICSLAASMATKYFLKSFTHNVLQWQAQTFNDTVGWSKDDEKLDEVYENAIDEIAEFDARCFNLPIDEVPNYFYWRQQDAIRNSINMLGQHYFSHAGLQCKSQQDIIQMLKDFENIDWEDLPIHLQRGSCALKRMLMIVDDPDKQINLRDKWFIDMEPPVFKDDWTYITKRL